MVGPCCSCNPCSDVIHAAAVAGTVVVVPGRYRLDSTLVVVDHGTCRARLGQTPPVQSPSFLDCPRRGRAV